MIWYLLILHFVLIGTCYGGDARQDYLVGVGTAARALRACSDAATFGCGDVRNVEAKQDIL